MSFDYWREAVESSLGEHGIVATPEQVAEIAKDMEGAAECRSMGAPDAPHPAIEEVARLRLALKRQIDKVACRGCCGRGFVGSPGRTCRCDACDGRGMLDP